MLFEKRTKKALKIIWGVLCIVIIISMILLYFPALLA